MWTGELTQRKYGMPTKACARDLRFVAASLGWQVGGHALLMDLSTLLNRSQTWYAEAADWTQFQQNAQRTGVFAGP